MTRTVRHTGIVFALWAIFCLIQLQSAQAKRLIPVDSNPTQPGSGLSVTVTNEKGALAEARVWVETAEGKLLAEGETTEDGSFSTDLSDEVLNSGVTVTAYASGHSAVSFIGNMAHRVSMELPLLPFDSYAILEGRLTGFKEPDSDSDAMVGLVAKAFELTDLVQLDSSSFISPLKDTINVFGPREIPSNLVLPDQEFPIYFIPIRVNKPTYRLPVLSGSSSRYFGVSGWVDVEKAIGAIRNDDAWSIVNLLEFNKVGVTRVVDAPRGNRQKLKVDVTSDVAIRETIRLRPGRNTTGGTDSNRLAVALWEPFPGTFVPTDVKKVETESLKLTTVENRTAKILDVLVSGNGERFRGAWVGKNASTLPDAGLTAGLDVNSLEGTWTIRGGETAQLMIGHVETLKKTSVGSSKFEDRWVLVSQRRAQMHLPAAALQALRSKLGTISHVSVDLLQLARGSYPILDGDSSASDLSVLEKARTKLK